MPTPFTRYLALLFVFYCTAGFANSLPSRSFHFSTSGSQTGDGSLKKPWNDLARLATLDIRPGDSILLKGGDIFKGPLVYPASANGSAGRPVLIGSYGHGPATIDAGDSTGILVNHVNYLSICNLVVTGSGRKSGNRCDGVIIKQSGNIRLDSIMISGFQKSGLRIFTCSDVVIEKIYAHDNGYAGISVKGTLYAKKDNHAISILHCRSENNPGDPAELKNQSGNGIVVSQCTKVRIAWCTATNNGWDMPRQGNGPVGIWTWDADSVVIEYCLSFRNKTSRGGGDGGGFDLDGGTTNSVIQHCLSYENAGSGIGLFQYNYSGDWKNNIVRNNISINDGLVSEAGAGIYIWNSSETDTMKQCFVYNNTIINNSAAAVSFSATSINKDFEFYNNILTGRSAIIAGGTKISGNWEGNTGWSYTGNFSVKQLEKNMQHNPFDRFPEHGLPRCASDLPLVLRYSLKPAQQRAGIDLLRKLPPNGADQFLKGLPSRMIGAVNSTLPFPDVPGL